MPRTQHTTRPPRRSKRRTREQTFLERVHLNATGIDIGSGSHWVAVPPDRDEQPVREFRSFTHALIDLADWLTACDVDTVAMESTGVSWIPLYEMLEARGFSVLLVNARHVKNVPGRKSDVSDCSGSSGSIPLACCAAAFGPPRRSPPSVRCCVTETPSWRGRPPVSNGCRRR